MKRERLIVSAIAVVAVLGLNACSQTRRGPAPQQQAATTCSQPTQIVRLEKAKYKYVKVRVQPAKYAKVQPIQSACSLKNN